MNICKILANLELTDSSNRLAYCMFEDVSKTCKATNDFQICTAILSSECIPFPIKAMYYNFALHEKIIDIDLLSLFEETWEYIRTSPKISRGWMSVLNGLMTIIGHKVPMPELQVFIKMLAHTIEPTINSLREVATEFSLNNITEFDKYVLLKMFSDVIEYPTKVIKLHEITPPNRPTKTKCYDYRGTWVLRTPLEFDPKATILYETFSGGEFVENELCACLRLELVKRCYDKDIISFPPIPYSRLDNAKSIWEMQEMLMIDPKYAQAILDTKPEFHTWLYDNQDRYVQNVVHHESAIKGVIENLQTQLDTIAKSNFDLQTKMDNLMVSSNESREILKAAVGSE